MIRNKYFVGFNTIDLSPGKTKTTLYDIDLIKRDLMNQFMTYKGERVMLPNYGTTIRDQLFEPFTDQVKNIIVQDVLHVINSEPRVQLKKYNVYRSEHGIAVSADLLYVPWNVVNTLDMMFDAENKV